VLTPLLAIMYWFWRLGGRHNVRGIAGLRATARVPQVEASPAFAELS
jgi:hypothetical protein